MVNGSRMLPSQFQSATGFANGNAIVKIDGKYGILQGVILERLQGVAGHDG